MSDGSAGETDGEGSRLVVVGRGRGPADYMEHVQTWRPGVAREHHIVVSLLPNGRFTVDHLKDDPYRTLQRWRREGDKRLPVAAFPFADKKMFAAEAGLGAIPARQLILTAAHARWIRKAPLVTEWLRPVRLHAARYENAACVLAQLRVA